MLARHDRSRTLRTGDACSRFFALGVLAISVNLSSPGGLSAQQASWATQLEGHAGWLVPIGEATQVTDADGSVQGVKLSTSSAFGGRALFPVGKTLSWGLGGRLSLGIQGFVSQGAEMRSAIDDSVLGSADYYQVAGIVALPTFVDAEPINGTINGNLGIGIGHTVYEPDTGFELSDGTSSTALVLNAGLGIDFLVAPMVSLVTYAGANFGFGDAGVDMSFEFVGGLALRFPFDGGPKSSSHE